MSHGMGEGGGQEVLRAWTYTLLERENGKRWSV